MRISFSDLVDLQSRLVLLPRIEEEGVGAVVASYTPRDFDKAEEGSSFQEEKKADDDAEASLIETKGSKGSMDSVALTIEPDENDDEKAAISPDQQSTATEDPYASSTEDQEDGKDEISEKNSSQEKEPPLQQEQDFLPEDVIGKSLIGISGLETANRWLDTDFSQILSTFREVKAPIVLELDFIPVAANNEHNTNKEGSIVVVEEDKEAEGEAKLETSSLNVWSSWGKSIAATAASSAKEYASATALAVAKKAEEARLARQLKAMEAKTEAPHEPEQRCHVFLQMIDGSFMPLSGPQSRGVKITTTSVVLVRQTSGAACPNKTHRFQWYRSVGSRKNTDASSNSSRASMTSCGSSSGGEEQWMILEGATYAAYQPNATDIGHRLRCIVSIDSEIREGHFSEEGDSLSEETVVCNVSVPVAADMSMFNAARQALVRGAHFGNLVGRGSAEGRTFTIHIVISMSPEDRSVSSALTIQQVSEHIAEPIHKGQIRNASALADPSNPKYFELIFPPGLPDEGSMLSALCVEGRFQLATPNRVARETLLFALGIANYEGRPVDLTETTMLYPGQMEDADAAGAESELPMAAVISTPVKQVTGDEGADEVAEFFTPSESVSSRKNDAADTSCDKDSSRVPMLEHELRSLVAKLSRKDKAVSDLNRQLAQSESRIQKAERRLCDCQQDLQKTQEDLRENRNKVRAAEKRIETQADTIYRMKNDSKLHIASLDDRVKRQAEKISELEKTTRSLQNEKAVMAAAIDARDSKLEKMKDLQGALDALSMKAAKGDSLRSELTDMSKRYEMLCTDLEHVAASETECQEQLQKVQSTMNELYQSLEFEKSRRKQGENELEGKQRTIQKLKAERNSYKQKADSLTKEIGRLCRGGRTVMDIEKILSDDESRKTEVAVLKGQKKQALEDLDQYRAAYEQQLVAQLSIGVDGAAVKALEQKAELERVVADMTEYVNAKEMQLETMKQINEALTEELRLLAKANMSKNEV